MLDHAGEARPATLLARPGDTTPTSIGARLALGHGWTVVGELDGEQGGGWHSVSGNATIRKIW